MPWVGSVPVREVEHRICVKPTLTIWTKLGRLWQCPVCGNRYSVQPKETTSGTSIRWRREDAK